MKKKFSTVLPGDLVVSSRLNNENEYVRTQNYNAFELVDVPEKGVKDPHCSVKYDSVCLVIACHVNIQKELMLFLVSSGDIAGWVCRGDIEPVV